MTYSKHEHYTSKETWNDYDTDGLIENKKIPKILSLIPVEVQSIIDIGCGNGIITNQLHEKYDVTGVDFSEEALKYVKAKNICCSADTVPVPDHSFDLVFSSEMLEHLPKKILDGAIEEIKRISKKYVLITLPHDEFLDQTFVKCPNCSNIFHANGHLHSFTEKKLSAMLGDNFALQYFELFGYQRKTYNRQLLKIRHNNANRYYNPFTYTICPECGNEEFPKPKGNIVSKICNGLNLIVSPKKPYWMVALYSRK